MSEYGRHPLEEHERVLEKIAREAKKWDDLWTEIPIKEVCVAVYNVPLGETRHIAVSETRSLSVKRGSGGDYQFSGRNHDLDFSSREAAKILFDDGICIEGLENTFYRNLAEIIAPHLAQKEIDKRRRG